LARVDRDKRRTCWAIEDRDSGGRQPNSRRGDRGSSRVHLVRWTDPHQNPGRPRHISEASRCRTRALAACRRRTRHHRRQSEPRPSLLAAGCGFCTPRTASRWHGNGVGTSGSEAPPAEDNSILPGVDFSAALLVASVARRFSAPPMGRRRIIRKGGPRIRDEERRKERFFLDQLVPVIERAICGTGEAGEAHPLLPHKTKDSAHQQKETSWGVGCGSCIPANSRVPGFWRAGDWAGHPPKRRDAIRHTNMTTCYGRVVFCAQKEVFCWAVSGRSQPPAPVHASGRGDGARSEGLGAEPGAGAASVR